MRTDGPTLSASDEASADPGYSVWILQNKESLIAFIGFFFSKRAAASYSLQRAVSA